jgi:hypothetical protein
MLRVFRHILFLLVAVALVGGTPLELAHAAQYGAMPAAAGMPCDMAMPASGDTKPMTPCKGLTADCIKQMGCVSVDALPAHFAAHTTTVQYSAVGYWTVVSELASLDGKPEPLPPRTA